MRIAVLLFIYLSLAACSDGAPRNSQTAKEKRAARIAKAEDLLSVTPVPRTYTVGGNQLIVLDVPTRNGYGFVDSQKCFVWRDHELNMASISCPQPAEISVDR